MIDIAHTIQTLLKFAWDGFKKASIRYPAYVLIRERSQTEEEYYRIHRSR